MPQLVWFITGTSSGLGAAVAKAALANGDKVIATARGSVDRLRGLKEAGATTMSLDVTADVAEIQNTIEEAIGVYGRIDVVVPNAA
jgi:NADP-dependent 3-hydroxy acid dehydrogenase YdfG